MVKKTEETKKSVLKKPKKPSVGVKYKSEKEPKATTRERKPFINQIDIIKQFSKTTSQVVQKAASILEEEIAAGIIAAKQVENSVINVKELRSGKPDEVIHRFRRDAHELVDIFIDVTQAATNHIGKLSQRVITIHNPGQQEKSESTTAGELPTLMVPESIKAGNSTVVPMILENKSDQSTGKFSFHCTNLVNASGEGLSARHITFNPLFVNIESHKTKTVNVNVNIPKGTSPGVYSGLIQATKMGQLQAVLVVQTE